MKRNGYVCPGCKHYGWPDECSHRSEWWEFAKAMAAHVDSEPVDESTTYGVEKIDSFQDDAENCLPAVGSAPWVIETIEPVDGMGYDFAYVINGVVCMVREGGKDCPSYAEPVARLRPAPAPSGAQPASQLDLERGICSCGNHFDGDNLCMASACEQEGAQPGEGEGQ